MHAPTGVSPAVWNRKHYTHIHTHACTHPTLHSHTYACKHPQAYPLPPEIKNTTLTYIRMHAPNTTLTYIRMHVFTGVSPAVWNKKYYNRIHTHARTHRRIPCHLELNTPHSHTYECTYPQAYPLPSGTKNATFTYIRMHVPTGESPAVWNKKRHTHIHTHARTHRRIPCRLEQKTLHSHIRMHARTQHYTHIHTHARTHRHIPCHLEQKILHSHTYACTHPQAYPLPSGTKETTLTYIRMHAPTGISPATWNKKHYTHIHTHARIHRRIPCRLEQNTLHSHTCACTYPQAYPLPSGTKHTTHSHTCVCTHRRIPCCLELNTPHTYVHACVPTGVSPAVWN